MNDRRYLAAIDPGLRNTAVVRVDERGFSWNLIRTPPPAANRDRFPWEAVYRDQNDARKLFPALSSALGSCAVLLACELATHAEESRAGSCMFIARGVVAAVEQQLVVRDSTLCISVLPNEVKRACGVPEFDRSGPRGPKLMTQEERRARSRARSERAKEIKLALERHVLKHFPELTAIEANIGASRKNHVFDAVGILIASLRKLEPRNFDERERVAAAVGSAMMSRLLSAHADAAGAADAVF